MQKGSAEVYDGAARSVCAIGAALPDASCMLKRAEKVFRCCTPCDWLQATGPREPLVQQLYITQQQEVS